MKNWKSYLVFGLIISMMGLAGCGGGGNDTPVNTAFGVTTASLPAATVGTAYNQTLAANNGTTPYTWGVTAGTLPAGLALSSAGVITGTPTTAATSNFTVTVTDSTTPTAKTATMALSIIVNPRPALSVTTVSPLAPGTVGTIYGPVTLVASGGTAPYTWTVAAGSALPAGLIVSTAGVITGTPTTAGTVSTNFTVTDAVAGTVTKALSISVNAAGAPVSITTASPLAAGTVGAAYGPVTMAATGGTTPYTWTIAVGSALPAGLVLSTGGVISGTPTTAGTVSTSIRVTDAAAGTVTNAFSITVNGTAPALTTLTPSCASACHGLPPTTVPNVAGSTSTMPHTTNTLCGICHVIGGWVPGTTTFNMAGVTTHQNGTINFLAGLPTASCGNCHAGPPGLPPLIAAHPAVAARAYVANCGICHPVGPGNPITMPGSLTTHDNGVINFNP